MRRSRQPEGQQGAGHDATIANQSAEKAERQVHLASDEVPAAAAERAIELGSAGPLSGIPVSVMELIDVVGQPPSAIAP